jgi:hypothetical protein
VVSDSLLFVLGQSPNISSSSIPCHSQDQSFLLCNVHKKVGGWDITFNNTF